MVIFKKNGILLCKTCVINILVDIEYHNPLMVSKENSVVWIILPM